MLEFDDIQHILLMRVPALTGRYEFLSFRNATGGRGEQRSTKIARVGRGGGRAPRRWPGRLPPIHPRRTPSAPPHIPPHGPSLKRVGGPRPRARVRPPTG